MNFRSLKTSLALSIVTVLLSFDAYSQCNPCYAIVNNGNWNSTASWSATPGGLASSNIPAAGDTVIIGESGAMNINLAANSSISKIKIFGAGSLTYNAGNVTLTITNGDSLILMDGSIIDGNAQSNPRMAISGSSVLDILTEGTGNRIQGITRITITNTGNTNLLGTGDVSINGQIRFAGNATFNNNTTGSLSATQLWFASNNSTLINTGKISVSDDVLLIAANTNITNSDTIEIADRMYSNSNTDDGHIITNNGYLSVGGNIDLFDADWTINNSGELVHQGNFANVGGAEVFSNLNGGTWRSAAASHAGLTMNCDDAVNTFIYNGSGAQDVFVPSDGEYYNLAFENAGLKTLSGAVIVQDSLTLTAGYVDIASNSLTLGTAPATPGTLVYTDGGLYGGGFTRYYDAATVADGDAAGLFPMANSNLSTRPFYVTAPSTGPSPGGTITVSPDNTTTTSEVSVTDGAATIFLRYDGFWTVSTGGGITGGSYNLSGRGVGFGIIGDVNDLRLMLNSGVVGTVGTNGGTTGDPQVNRTSLTLGEIADNFYVGSTDTIQSPLPINIEEFEGMCIEDELSLHWITSNEEPGVPALELSRDGEVWTQIENEELQVSGEAGKNFIYHVGRTNGLIHFRLVDPTEGTVIATRSFDCSTVGAKLKVSPNPATEIVQIKSVQEISSVMLTNARGESVFMRHDVLSYDLGLDISELPHGVYILRIVAWDGSISSSRIIKSAR